MSPLIRRGPRKALMKFEHAALTTSEAWWDPAQWVSETKQINQGRALGGHTAQLLEMLTDLDFWRRCFVP